MHEKAKIENLQDSNIDDVINVSSSKRLKDPVHMEGIRLKRLWLKEMLDNYGSCAKVAYYSGKPAAQILYYPEVADKTKVFKREDVLLINCIYNPTTEAHGLGLGRMLLQSVIQDVKQRKSCLGNKPCKFIWQTHSIRANFFQCLTSIRNMALSRQTEVAQCTFQ